jgi:hypothetical protein
MEEAVGRGAIVGSCEPIRAKFGKSEDSDPTLGWDFLTSKQPFWITGPDAIAANLMSGKPIKILEAIKIIPHGVQSGLKPVKLYDRLEVDPIRDDLAVKLVALRASMKDQNPQLAGGLKVAANSAAFGLLCQMNVKDLDSPSPLHVFSGEANYLSNCQTLGAARRVLLPRDRFTRNGRIAFAVCHVGTRGPRHGRPDRSNGYR